jgi:hypothetical protein
LNNFASAKKVCGQLSMRSISTVQLTFIYST